MNQRVAVLTSSYPRAPGDASGHFVQSEVRRMASAGREVHVFAPGSGLLMDEGAFVHWLGDRGAFGWPGALQRLREQPARLLGAAEFAVRARHALRAQHRASPFRSVQAHFLVPSAWPIATLAFGPDADVTTELVGHGTDVRLFCRLPKPLRKHITREWLRRRVELRVTSHELRALLGAEHPELLPLLRVEMSPISVPGVRDRIAARRALEIPLSAQVAIIVSRLIPEKKVALALRALALTPDVLGIVVGEGPELAALSARFPRVRFTGRLPRPEALRFIAAADVLLSASPEEGAPTVVREARALGVPVVAVAAGDLRAWAAADAGILLACR